MEKTKCCGFLFDSEQHNPIQNDGYCTKCGYHPNVMDLKSKVKDLKMEVKELKKMLVFLEDQGKW